jgi:anti-anti-sigma regulatory factor
MQGSSTAKEISLKGSLVIDKAAEIKKTLCEALSSPSAVLVDLSSAEEIDLSCIQMLYAAKRTAEKKGVRFGFTGSIPARIVKKFSSSGFVRGTPEKADEFEAALVGFRGSGE